MKSVFLVVLPLFLFLSGIAPIFASTVTSASIVIAPSKGDVTTSIFVHVRGEPYYSSESEANFPVLYLYYDDSPMVRRLQPSVCGRGFGSWYECIFDINITVPNIYPYSELGNHTITAVIEASGGTTANATATFEIIKYYPPIDDLITWWNELNATEKALFTGPQGPAGPQGIQGLSGINGSMWYNGNGIPSYTLGVGNDYYLNIANGDVYQRLNETWVLISNIHGSQGIQGLQGVQGPQGVQGVQGVQGIQGLQGVQGPQGTYPYDLAWLNVAIASVALIVSAMVLVRGYSKIPKGADK